MQNESCIMWLLKDDNPGVQYRTQTEILGIPGDKEKVRNWIIGLLPQNWQEAKGLTYTYSLTALAEAGLTREDIPDACFQTAMTQLENNFTNACSDLMLLRALLLLGFHDDERILHTLAIMDEARLPDGGFVCDRVRAKLDHVPKSCYKADLQALLFLSVCHKRGIRPMFGDALINYFFKRDIFYRSGTRALVLDGKIGWRNVDTFSPCEVMRVGLQNIVEAFSALGYGNDKRLCEAWRLLEAQRDALGRVLLAGTLSKPYLPKEKVGRPSKWATFYQVLAEKQRRAVE